MIIQLRRWSIELYKRQKYEDPLYGERFLEQGECLVSTWKTTVFLAFPFRTSFNYQRCKWFFICSWQSPIRLFDRPIFNEDIPF